MFAPGARKRLAMWLVVAYRMVFAISAWKAKWANCLTRSLTLERRQQRIMTETLWCITFEECTVGLLKQIKQGEIDGDSKMVTIQEWKGEGNGIHHRSKRGSPRALLV